MEDAPVIAASAINPDYLEALFAAEGKSTERAKHLTVRDRTYWVQVTTGSAGEYVAFRTAFSVSARATEDALLRFVNRAGVEVFALACFWDSEANTVYFEHHHFCAGGTTKATILYALDRYQDMLYWALEQDTENVVQ